MVSQRLRPLGLPAPLVSFVGPVNGKKPRINSNPGPSGSRGPTSQGGQNSAAVTVDALPFNCDFPGCGRSFGTKTGKGVHHRRAHPDWFDAQQNTMATKARWTEEETLLLARRESELVQQGEKFINQALIKDFPERSLESIKSKRKQPAYRKVVADMLESIPAEEDNGTVAASNADTNVDYKTAIVEFLTSLPAPRDGSFSSARLVRICNSLSSKSQKNVVEDLTLYLRNVFPIQPRQKKAKKDIIEIRSRKQERRAEYARTQDLWRKNRSKCLRMLLDDITGVQAPSKEVMAPFWETIMTVQNTTSPGRDTSSPTIDSLWAPITTREIRNALPANTTSAGPDGLSARALRAVPIDVLMRILNIILWCESAPTHLLESVTTLIPKKSNAHCPSDFRPITVSSVLTRTLHKVLATRMANLIHLDQRQRAFRPTDGCSDNVFLLDLMLRHHHRHHKPLYMASLDIAKAFDSVSHNTIRETLEMTGLPRPMTSYIMDVYQRSTTTLCCDSWTSKRIRPTCGVKQGDPMSPMIFNLIMDRMLKKLPNDVGAKIGGLSINAAAFADDLLLFASTPIGLQKLLDLATNYLSKCGLAVNASKCMTVALRNVPHEKRTIVDKDTVFLCANKVLPALKRTDEWRYLGIPFTPEGRVKLDIVPKLQASLDKLTKAPLKPQQRLFGLRTMVLPGLYHQVELGNINISVLRKCDRVVRCKVRNWLSLPSDTPNAYIHANVKDGGLGIGALRWNAPLKRLQRLLRLPLSDPTTNAISNAFLREEVEKCRNRLKVDGQHLCSEREVRGRWARMLYEKVDGKGLQESAKVPQQHAWVHEGTRFLSGHDFLQSCKLRINALPTRSRCARGRPKDRHCRAGCNRAETLNHILQQCHRTHGSRIKRHDAIASYVCRTLETREFQVSVEPKIRTNAGLRKPDIVAKLGTTALVIDAQVINDQFDLDTAHNNKVEYYKNIEGYIKESYSVDTVVFSSITLSWRGVWSKKSAEHMTSLGVLRKRQLKVLSSRAIIGGLACFHTFNRTTQVGE